MSILLVYSSVTHLDLFKKFKFFLIRNEINYEEIYLYECTNSHSINNILDKCKVDFKVNSALKYIRFIIFYNKRKKIITNFLKKSYVNKAFIANDVGFVEKLIIEALRELRAETYLVQDGLVDMNSRNSIIHLFLYQITKILKLFKLSQFGFNKYGAYFVDFILSIGNVSNTYFEQVKDSHTKIINFGYFRFIEINQDSNTENINDNNLNYIYYLGGFEISNALRNNNINDFENLKLICDLFVNIKANKNLYIVTHPSSNKDKIIQILRHNSIENFHIIDKDSAFLISNSLHFTYSSSVIFELIYRNKNAFIVDKNSTSNFSEIYNPCKLGYYINDLDSFLNCKSRIEKYNLIIREIMKGEFSNISMHRINEFLKSS